MPDWNAHRVNWQAGFQAGDKFNSGTWPSLQAMLAEMDTALNDELLQVKRFGNVSRTVRNGRLIGEVGGHYEYTFTLDEPWEPEDNTPLTLKFGGASFQGIVITASGLSIMIGTEFELPTEALAQINLTDDPSQLLERLRDTLKTNTEGDSQLGSKVFGLLSFVNNRDHTQQSFSNFTPRPSQTAAIAHALGSEVAYIIGPPGTGKTSTLAAIVYALICKGRSVLIASHTNIAVDNAIIRLADMCREVNLPALHEGRIIRLGTPQLESVKQREDVYPPKIVKHIGLSIENRRMQVRERRSKLLVRLQTLVQQQEQLSSRWDTERVLLVSQRTGILQELAPLQQVEQHRLSSLDAELQQANQAQADARQRLEKAREMLSKLVAQEASTQHMFTEHLDQASALAARLARAQKMNSVGRLLRRLNLDRLARQAADAKQHVWRDEQTLNEIRQQIGSTHQSIDASQQDVEYHQTRIEDLTREVQRPTDESQRINELRDILSKCDQRIAHGDANLEKDAASLRQEREQITTEEERLGLELTALDQQLRDLERRLLDDAQVVATTLSKVYMEPRLREHQFDTVILDEASMAPLPAVYIAASRANNSVIVIGDPQQLAPIVQAKSAAAARCLGRDIFAVTNITLESTVNQDKRTSLLREQSRMHSSISEIANKHVYNNLLIDVSQQNAADYVSVQPLSGARLVLCDTDDGAPIANRPNGSSRVNLYHALCDLAVSRQILESLPPPSTSFDENTFRVGIVAPYKKQAQLLQRMVRSEGLEKQIRVGTIHRFQGLEFEAIVFDTVESPPIPHRREFIGGGKGSEGQRLVNVAVTRAKHKLVIVANAAHISAEFDLADTLRLAVGDAQKSGVIKSRAMLGSLLRDTFTKHLRTATQQCILNKTRLLNDVTFFDSFLQDVRTAHSHIIIVSPFVRSERTNSVISELQVKCASGIRVTVLASDSGNGNQTIDKRAAQTLQNAGVEFRTSAGMHEKLVLIDDRIVYLGSLNPLSHNATTELMARIESTEFAKEVARLLYIPERTAEADWGEDFVISIHDLPVGGSCLECGRPIKAHLGKYGPFYRCSGTFEHPKFNVAESQLRDVPMLNQVICNGCNDGLMRPRAQRKDMWLECGAPNPCTHRRRIVVER